MGRELITELMNVARRKIQTQGDFPGDEDAIEDIVDEVIDEFQHDGLMSDDEDVGLLRSAMIQLFREELR